MQNAPRRKVQRVNQNVIKSFGKGRTGEAKPLRQQQQQQQQQHYNHSLVTLNARCALSGPAIKLYIWPNGPSAACADCTHLLSVDCDGDSDGDAHSLCTQSNMKLCLPVYLISSPHPRKALSTA
ncbi:hypothetical protein AWZ03_004829 [Drosophila navojoa]|uniref:Uncharacterized protein n=1 Tax=Drosophila navojoa TaxID=7232 RepID=A0A484BIW4_DRONA|nr:hypothetical protein AWZ03_004829 [Drosophila navojoa]